MTQGNYRTNPMMDLVLEEVRETGPVTAAEIARSIGRSEDTVRRALKGLESVGLVESDNYQRRARVFMEVES